MAIPTLLKRADFSGLDFTPGDANLKFIAMIKSALVTFGWAIEFEQDDDVVFSNNGSGYMLKFSPDSSADYVLVETAQSWSDIDTPVAQLVSQLLYVNYVTLNFSTSEFFVLGDDKRFYFGGSSNPAIDTQQSVIVYFGDIATFVPTDPFTFVYIGQSSQSVATTRSSAARGMLLSGQTSISTSNQTQYFEFFGLQDATVGNLPGTLYSPGGGSEFHRDVIVNSIQTTQPIILIPNYVFNSSLANETLGSRYANYARGILPGLHSALFPTRELLNLDSYETTDVAGTLCMAIPPNSGNGKANKAIVMNDWDLLL